MPQTERVRTALAERYRLERELGQGGMATVYLAEDRKHHRQVAIKVLKPELAAVIGAERFVQEITTTASLQHPHILPLFDSGEADGFLYYVMPFIDGETLRDKLDRETQLGVEEAVRIATEVADALQYAHTRGVIHRDIKPENILLQDGRALVADFGIALAVSSAAGGRLTETGLSLGTPHYMSPEQATADKDITARSDQYALASVLYEMLAGAPPHTGASAQQIIIRIITEPAPDVTGLRASVPAPVADALARALEKLPADRFPTTKDFAQALHGGADGERRSRSTTTAAAPVAPPPSRLPAALAAALVLSIAVAAAGWWRTPAAPPVSRFAVTFAGDGGNGAPQPSPDGSRYAYSGAAGELRVRDRDAFASRTVADEAWTPFFSPDGSEIGFATGFPGALRIASLTTGSVRTLVADSVFGYGGSWSSDGWVYYVGGPADAAQVRRVPSAGGIPEVVAAPDAARDELFFYWPQVLPGGRQLLVSMFPLRGDPVVMAVDVGSGETTVLTPGVRGVYAASGQLLVLRTDGTIAAAAFDPERAEITGPLVPVVEDVSVQHDAATFFVSRDGTLTYRTPLPRHRVVRVTRDGVERPVDPDWTAHVTHMSVAPDETRLALGLETGGRIELWTKALPHGPLTRVAYDGILNTRPKWLADGRTITFTSDRSGKPQLYRMPADASAEATLVRSDPRAIDEGEYSADGRWLSYRTGSGGDRDAYVVRTDGTATPIALGGDAYDDYAPTIAPDGRAVAYVSDESGRPEVYVRPLPDVASERLQVSTDGGSEPMWSRDGRELFHRSRAGDLVSVRFAPGEPLRVAERRTLFSLRGYVTDNWNRAMSVAPDDQSFYLLRFVDADAAADVGASDIVVVQHWFAELAARMEAGK